MKVLLPLLLLPFLTALPVNAAPTYLTCSITETASEVGGKVFEPSKTPLTVELTLNEDQQTASYYLPSTGLTQRVGANFQRDVITFKTEKQSSSTKVSGNWSLDRVAGTLTRSTQVYATGAVPMKMLDKTSSGPCKKATAPERQF